MNVIDPFGQQMPLLASLCSRWWPAWPERFLAFTGLAAINLRADQTIGGTALNMLAPAFAIVLTWSIQGRGRPPSIRPDGLESPRKRWAWKT